MNPFEKKIIKLAFQNKKQRHVFISFLKKADSEAEKYKEYTERKKTEGGKPLDKEQWERYYHGGGASEKESGKSLGKPSGGFPPFSKEVKEILSNPDPEKVHEGVTKALKDTGSFIEKANKDALAEKAIKKPGVMAKIKGSFKSLEKVLGGEPIGQADRKNLETAGAACLLATLVGLPLAMPFVPLTFPAAVIFFAGSAWAKKEGEEGIPAKKAFLKKSAEEEEAKEFAKKILGLFIDFMKNTTPEQIDKIITLSKKESAGKDKKK